MDLSLNGSGGYDSNPFGEENGTAEGVFGLLAVGSVMDTLESGSYRVGYSPNFLAYTDSPKSNQVYHAADVSANYILTRRTTIFLQDSFGYIKNIQRDSQSNSLNDQGNDALLRNSASLSVVHQFTQRLSNNTTGFWEVNDYVSGDQQGNSYVAAQSSVDYQLSLPLSVGVGGTVGYRSFDPTRPASNSCNPNAKRPGSSSLNYSGFLTASYVWDPTTSFSVSAGPAQIDSRNFALVPTNPCPSNPSTFDFFYERQERSRLTWFAAASASKSWKNIAANASYRRSEGVGGSGSGASINDSVNLGVSWKFGRLWSANAGGGWLRRQSSGIGGNQTQNLTTWRANATIARQLTQWSTVSVSGSYIDQETSGGSGGATTSYDAIRVDAAFTYRFDPWHF